VLHGPDGRPLRRTRLGDLWRQLCLRAGLPGAVFHNCRHTFASTLLSGGVSVAAAADYLGHSPAVLLRTYAHLLPANHDRAREVIQSAFARKAVCHPRVSCALGRRLRRSDRRCWREANRRVLHQKAYRSPAGQDLNRRLPHQRPAGLRWSRSTPRHRSLGTPMTAMPDGPLRALVATA
jgi:hypothetical protein